MAFDPLAKSFERWVTSLRERPTRSSVSSPRASVSPSNGLPRSPRMLLSPSGTAPLASESPRASQALLRASLSGAASEGVEHGSLKRVYESSLGSMQQIIRQEHEARRQVERDCAALREVNEDLQDKLHDESMRCQELSDALARSEQGSVALAQQMQRELDALRTQLGTMVRVGRIADVPGAEVPAAFPFVLLARDEYLDMLRQRRELEQRADVLQAEQTRLLSAADSKQAAHNREVGLLQLEVEKLLKTTRDVTRENGELRITIEAVRTECQLLQGVVAEASQKDAVVRSLEEHLYSARQQIQSLRQELEASKQESRLRLQEQSFEVASQRQTVVSLQEALKTARSTLEAESAIHHIHDINALQQRADNLQIELKEKSIEYENRLTDKDGLIKTLRQSLQRANESHAAAQQRIDLLQRQTDRLQAQLKAALSGAGG